VEKLTQLRYFKMVIYIHGVRELAVSLDIRILQVSLQMRMVIHTNQYLDV
jgi:hypothetical protein